ncbi:Organic cation/carnitine transporter [Arachis hypogaea]|nr:Organic cation/carnitine transporter [Arachis hypogaea]
MYTKNSSLIYTSLDNVISGAGIFGHLSDSNLGRKGSLTMVCILNTITGTLTSLAPNYLSYVTLRFLTGFSTGGVGLCAFVLATEPIGPTMRGVAGMSTFYFFSPASPSSPASPTSSQNGANSTSPPPCHLFSTSSLFFPSSPSHQDGTS